jgi:uncharacterized protein
MHAGGGGSGDLGAGWQPGDGSVQDRTWLTDWRRRVTTLYGEVRAIAASDPAAALAHWRTVRESLYRTHPQSPVPAAERADFRARHFDSDGSMRFRLAIQAAPADAPGSAALMLPNSGSEAPVFSRIGTIELPLPGGSRRLSVFWMAGYAGGLFIPFRDTTNGAETYGAGRYLVDSAKGADLGGDAATGHIVVDFDYAIQPSCAFDPRWACPLAPPENWLDVPVRAGERLR